MSQAVQRILVLGAYGFFGYRICEALAKNPRIQLILAGRDLAKATAAAYQLGLHSAHARAVDATHPQLALQLRKLGITTLIHTAGPFQGQGYEVARAAIKAGCNYLDLADGRAFVSGISSLDAEARAAAVAVVSGVSSLPALSAAVVDRYRGEFSRLDAIRIGITSGALIPGIATIRSILGYCGKPFRTLENGAWIDVHGWLDTQTREFPKAVGARLLGRCDVPDLELLPQRFAGVKTVSFHAGFSSATCHKAVERLALLVKDGKLTSAVPFAPLLHTLGRWMKPLFSDRGAMFVKIEGLHHSNGAPLALTWNLVARDNHGPDIPCAAAIALANKLASGTPLPAGATPCMGLLTVDELLAPLKGLSIREFPPLGPGGHEVGS
ncbi:MAG TPA: saccharopine dehydrogenase NADP-binding domain-containing protein [Steroidobacteraceae bacterium]|nr:saccharopine dehydrogenase NADP-binding domain-containing protein [Steroidobacteraceae bacterium]